MTRKKVDCIIIEIEGLIDGTHIEIGHEGIITVVIIVRFQTRTIGISSPNSRNVHGEGRV